MAVFVATSGADSFGGDSSNDVFVVNVPTDLNMGDVFSGGGGRNTLTLTGAGLYDLSIISISEIAELVFDNAASVARTFSR